MKDEAIAKLQIILSFCEMGMFTGASPGINRDNILIETKEVLSEIDTRRGAL